MRRLRTCIVGTGYVGLTNAVALAYLGHEVVCLDVDQAKVAMLSAGKIPIFEPHLEDLLASSRERMTFTTDYAQAIPKADVVFIAVGTPTGEGGAPDLRYLQAAAKSVGEHLGEGFTVVVNKSTVPIGSANWVEAIVRDAFQRRAGEKKGTFAVASNPEFLREGSALHDTLYADRTVLGADDQRAVEVLSELYRPITDQTFEPLPYLPRPAGLTTSRLITTDLASAELIKYAANAFLSLKISFINEIAELAERVGADVVQIAEGIGSDARVGRSFLQAGLGWGGSCFGKDTAALLATGREYGLEMPIVKAARDVNWRQRQRVTDKLLNELKILKGKTIGLLGLAFKPFTDDLRDAPALDIAARLLERGASVRVHDPVAMARVKSDGKLAVHFCESAHEVAEGADALVLVTEWPEYRRLPWESVAKSMRNPLILDGRNALEQQQLTKAGFRYIGMGR
ncbi:MAG TPA: UDP-glucose/GDP-mannose dehydrogenase family protein [Polyangiaceae bacterium]|nr:UDP-glucose/GDP-mannose dehydrogenase family protein [Polyangiaceae bacterium]